MKPTVELDGGRVRLWLGDCLSVLPTLAQGSVDAVVTDPPYGQGVAPQGTIGGRGEADVTQYDSAEWDSEPVPQWAIDMILSKSQWQVVFGGNNYSLPPSPIWLVWDKMNSGNFGDCEIAWTNLSGGVTSESRLAAAEIRRLRIEAGLTRKSVDVAVRGKQTGLCYRWEEGSCVPACGDEKKLAEALQANGGFFEILRAARASQGKATGVGVRMHRQRWNGMIRDEDGYRHHPTQKPIRLMEWAIAQCPSSRTVLDPFMGSGTTGVACVRLGRQFIGVEKEERYFDIAVKRIEAELNRTPLFDPKPVQRELIP